MVSAAVADIVSTELALRAHPHFEEGNPLLPNTGTRIAAKAGVTAALLIAARKLEADGHRDIAKWLRWPSIIAWTTATGWNVSLTIRVP